MKTKRLKIRKHLLLEALARFGESTTEHLIASLFYFPDILRRDRGVQSSNWFKKTPIKIEWETKIRFWRIIHKLKKDQLIVKTKKGYGITKFGANYLAKNPPRGIRYTPVKNTQLDQIVLVIFDIPEYLKPWREWLRLKLKEMDFSMLQQSVWYNRNSLPDIFVKDLERYKLLPYVHILSVNKQGTLSKWFERIGKHYLVQH